MERSIRPIGAVLIANRGEIALRIARSCRSRGVRVLGVYTAEDADQLHASSMDACVEVADYLDSEALIAAARSLGADAVHPGYGFLSENADFASAVEDAGLIWVGPPAAAIRAMGSKAEARRTMTERGVPVVPGYDGADQDNETLIAAAAEIGFPVLIKASAGGGGKGMQVVQAAADLERALEAARRLAVGAFGDGRLVIEKYVERPRHIEAQIIADGHGSVLHLLERECSIQRRHQKVIEEAPSPAFVGPSGRSRRDALLQDAVEAARAVGYVGAGTVEFIMGADGAHYFLEMNTRLQVEHPVTECVTGVDLVHLQLDVAEGRELDASIQPVDPNGHAVEVRLYAEDPDAGWLPRAGVLSTFEFPERTGLRVDAGVQTGARVGTAYDPMLGKIIAHGRDRAEAIQRLVGALRAASVLWVQTNLEHLIRTMNLPAFRSGDLHTGFYVEHADALQRAVGDAELQVAVGCAVLLARPEPSSVVGVRLGWQTNAWPEPPMRFSVLGDELEVVPSWTGDGVVLAEDGWTDDTRPPGVPVRSAAPLFREPVAVQFVERAGAHAVIAVGAERRRVSISESQDRVWVSVEGVVMEVTRLQDLEAPGALEQSGGLVAPMPGRVVQVLVSPGTKVSAGDPLVVLEAMKMEQVVVASASGCVTDLLVAEGDQVDGGQDLVVFEADSDASDAVQ